MAATVLNSPRAVQMSVYVVRAFVRLRQAGALHSRLAQELKQVNCHRLRSALRIVAIGSQSRHGALANAMKPKRW
jgi:hypothetical protein